MPNETRHHERNSALLTTTCASACTVRGAHQSDCVTSACKGCQPRLAFIGLLCEWCWQRLNADTRDIPYVLDHLHEIGQPRAKPQVLAQDYISHRPPADHVNLTPEWLAADELQSLLNSWISYIVELHPAGLRGPGKRDDAVKWIVPHLQWVAHQDFAPDMRSEISREIATLKARWPTPDMAENERAIPGVRCPRCEQISLTYTPPRHYRQAFQVACQNQDCARIFTEHEWERLTYLILTEHRKTTA